MSVCLVTDESIKFLSFFLLLSSLLSLSCAPSCLVLPLKIDTHHLLSYKASYSHLSSLSRHSCPSILSCHCRLSLSPVIFVLSHSLVISVLSLTCHFCLVRLTCHFCLITLTSHLCLSSSYLVFPHMPATPALLHNIPAGKRRDKNIMTGPQEAGRNILCVNNQRGRQPPSV